MAKIGTAAKIGGLAVAVVGLLTAIVHYNPNLVSNLVKMWTDPSKKFDTSYQSVETLLRQRKEPYLNAWRYAASDAYTAADNVHTTGDRIRDKCEVIHLFASSQDGLGQAPDFPQEAYWDYEQKVFSGPCQQDVATVAGLELDDIEYAMYATPSGGGLQAAAAASETLSRVNDVYLVVSSATHTGDSGWSKLALRDAGGYLTREVSEVTTLKNGGTVTIKSATTNGIPLHAFANDSPYPGVTGFLPNNSTATVQQLDPVEQDGTNQYDIWAQVKVVMPMPLATGVARGPTHLQFARRVATEVAMAPPNCPPFHQQNSRHGANPLWVFVGEKPDNDTSDAFFPGTSRVNTQCIPRDGQTVRATTDLRVFVGPDPYYPGVHPQGGIIIAGAQFRIVGDVSGYPFDATANPNFCNGNPPPHKSKALPLIPPGHQKRYCVYLPISPA